MAERNGDQSSSAVAASAPVPGVMWINSGVVRPEHLSEADFDRWYCDEHILDVVALSGVHDTARYEHVSTPAGALLMGTKSSKTMIQRKFLTVYEMPDLNYRFSAEFRGLEGQNPNSPSKDKIFKWAEFDSRWYEQVFVHEAQGAEPGPAPLLLSITCSHDDEAVFTNWNKGSRTDRIASCPGYRRSRHFRIETSSLLSCFVRSFPQVPTWLSLYEFDGAVLPWEELRKVDETPEAQKVAGGLKHTDWGCFELVRTYP